MAAGLGFKDFTTGEVLTAADVDGYLMQGVWVFASATARDAAVTSPQEGNFAYLKDTNVTTYYTGSAWANLDTTGMTNPMTTTGDTIYSSSGSTPARLGIGTAGQVLRVNSGATAPEWATPAGGGKVLQVVQGFIDTATSTASGSFSDTGVTATITPSSATSKVLILVSLSGIGRTSGGAVDKVVNFKMQKNGSDLVGMNYYMLFNNTTNEILGASMATNYLDSPATTSATTYKVQWVCDNGTSLIRLSYGSNISSITLLEIGA
jgi:hypothetical protein